MASVVAAWPTVALGEVLALDVDVVPVDATATYPIAGVYSFGRGLLARSPLPGTGTTYKVFHRLHTDQYVLSQLKAWEGALARVPAAFDGWYLSPQFPTFRADASRLDIAFLEWYCRQAGVWEQLRSTARGMGARRDSVTPAQFLRLAIPLPPLDEQRRIVARIEALAARIAEARGLRQAALAEVEALWKSELRAMWTDEGAWNVRQLGQLTRATSGQVDPQIEPYASMPHINGESMESGTCRLLPKYQSAKDDAVTSGKYHFAAGAILYSKIRPYLMKSVQVPFEGICSADVYAFETFDSSVLPRFFMYSLVSPRFTQYANEISGRTRMPKINQDQLYTFLMRVPPIEMQQRIVTHLDQLQARLNALKQTQAQVVDELDALMPSLLDKAFRGEL